MIGPSGNVRVLVATKPVDFRKGAEGLAAVVRESMRTDPFSGVVYVFRAKRADRVKLIFWDGSGVVLVSKRDRRMRDCASLGSLIAELGHQIWLIPPSYVKSYVRRSKTDAADAEAVGRPSMRFVPG